MTVVAAFGHWIRPGLVSGFAILFLVVGCSSGVSFHGTELTGANPASPFRLQNQFGDHVALNDLKGNVVVLTFLYTNCPDACPIITDAMRNAYDALGLDAQRTAFVAITVDPARDTVEEVNRYSEGKGMLHKWSFLTGNEEELAPVWRAYYVAAEPERVEGGIGTLENLSQEAATQASAVDIGTHGNEVGYLVSHTTPVYLIDRAGRLRVLFTDLTLDPAPLVHDIRLLLRAKPPAPL